MKNQLPVRIYAKDTDGDLKEINITELKEREASKNPSERVFKPLLNGKGPSSEVKQMTDIEIDSTQKFLNDKSEY